MKNLHLIILRVFRLNWIEIKIKNSNKLKIANLFNNVFIQNNLISLHKEINLRDKK